MCGGGVGLTAFMSAVTGGGNVPAPEQVRARLGAAMKREKHHRYVSRYGPSYRPDSTMERAAAAENEGASVGVARVDSAALPAERDLSSLRQPASLPRR